MDKNLSQNTLIGVIGAGTMGSGIAQIAAQSGHNVILSDTSKETVERSKSNFQSTFQSLLKSKKFQKKNRINIYHGFHFLRHRIFRNAGLIVEAVVEDLNVKQNIFMNLENTVSINCILASNTSSLSITSIASACKNPARVIGLHFFNPAPLLPLVEIIPGLATDENIISEIKKLMQQWNKIPVVAKDTPGFIVNRLARPFYGEAIRMYEEQWEGIPSGEKGFATIDNAMREKGFKMGPFELMDLIGNDVNYTVTETVWKQFFYDPKYKPSLTQKRLFEAKYFGKKSGRGYYDYSDNNKRSEPLNNSELNEKISNRILFMVINEAVEAMYMNVASKEDLDLAMIKGVNYPKGLLKWCDEIGASKVLDGLNELREIYSEERYRPSVLLKKIVKENKKFY